MEDTMADERQRQIALDAAYARSLAASIASQDIMATPLEREPQGGERTPLVGGAQRVGAGVARGAANPRGRAVRMNLAAEHVNEGAVSRQVVVGTTCFVNFSEILAGVIVLSMYWSEDTTCDEEHRNRWRWWAIVACCRMAAYTACTIIIYRLETLEQEVPRLVHSLRNSLDALGLAWFVVGNLWMSSSSGDTCNPWGSPIYRLDLAFLLITYIAITLPCIVAILMVPILCFCLPCVIRVLTRMQDPMRGKGATEAEISTIPVIKFGTASEATKTMAGSCCPICLNDYVDEDELRMLTCKHAIHKECLDNWLKVSGTCAMCRAPIPQMSGGGGNQNERQEDQPRISAPLEHV